jgi:hypothetical protein
LRPRSNAFRPPEYLLNRGIRPGSRPAGTGGDPSEQSALWNLLGQLASLNGLRNARTASSNTEKRLASLPVGPSSS